MTLAVSWLLLYLLKGKVGLTDCGQDKAEGASGAEEVQ